MKKALIFIFALMWYSSYSQKLKTSKKHDTTKVFICNSFSSKVYHLNKNCYQLKKCNDSIIRVSLHKAKNYARVYCKNESKSK